MYFQERNLNTAKFGIGAAFLLGLWWMCFSRVTWRRRWQGAGVVCAMMLASAAMFRIRGVSGDLLPIVEWRWQSSASVEMRNPDRPRINESATPASPRVAFPQFLGPQRDGVLTGPRLATNWIAHPPQLVWRRTVGAAWSGFAVMDGRAVTQEQRGTNECVVAYDLATGRELWVHHHAARFNTTIAGEGPRATPTIADARVLAYGATGLLTCLELASGRMVWSVDVLSQTASKLPDWGTTSAPLIVHDQVIVHGGEQAQHALHAFDRETGKLIWSAAEMDPSYAAPALVELAGVRQVLAFNHKHITAHAPDDGRVLWSRPWGNGNVVCSSPVIVSSNRVLFSSGYGYGAELLEIRQTEGKLVAERLWKSNRLKSKFGHLFVRDNVVFGLDDGVLAAVDLADGGLLWKAGRYGHGQGLVVGEHYLLLAESGELVLLQPTRTAPQELARWPVFATKTWNPPALVGNWLLVRNDQEAACLKLPVAAGKSAAPGI
jgi:outer membrane protein assembly factor BamB